MSEGVKDKDGDFVFEGEDEGIGGDANAFGDEDGADASYGKGAGIGVFGFDENFAIVYADESAVGVYEELHGGNIYMGITEDGGKSYGGFGVECGKKC